MTTAPIPMPVTVVTGGAGALGSAVAARFAAQGDLVVLLDRDRDATAQRAGEIAERTGAEVLPLMADLSDPAQATASVETISRQLGRLDRLINNAAFNPKQRLDAVEVDAWDLTMAVNLRAPMLLARAAVPIWRATRYGRIVNITSRTYLSGGPAAYTTSKAGIVGLTRSMAVELGPLGVTANAVAPSMIVTPFTRGGRSAEELDAFVHKHERMSVLGRLATVEDVVDAIAFLAGDNASFITGEVLHVAGGAQLAAAP
ncbi:SDR family oxidoreductase [Microbacterium sp. JZ70]